MILPFESPPHSVTISTKRNESLNMKKPPRDFHSFDKGWKSVWPFPHRANANSFLCGSPNGSRLRLTYFWNDRTHTLGGETWFGPKCEGPPGSAHGGSMAALLDETMGASAWVSGHSVVAAQISVS